MKRIEGGLRATEIEEITNLTFIHPIGTRLAKLFAEWGVTPNAVSLAGLVCGVLAGLAYYGYRDIWCAVAGFALMIAWHVMDGTDGQLARMTHATSGLGKILDGACDYTTFIAVYTAFAISGGGRWGDWMWLLVGGAGLCHAAQAAAYEAQREEYVFWCGRGAKKSSATRAASRRNGTETSVRSASVRWAYRAYRRLQIGTAGSTLRSRGMLSAIIEAEPERAPAIVDLYRRTFAPVVRRWSVLSSNYRTFGLFIAACFKVPQAYFLFEVVGLSAVLIVLSVYTGAKYRRFFAAAPAR